MARFAESHNDFLSAANHRTRLTDEPRHMALGVAVLKAMLADDPANIEILQGWQDEFAPLIRTFVYASRPIERIPGSDFSADAMWASIVDHHSKNAENTACARPHPRHGLTIFEEADGPGVGRGQPQGYRFTYYWPRTLRDSAWMPSSSGRALGVAWRYLSQTLCAVALNRLRWSVVSSITSSPGFRG